jgi:hypothetical protein
MKAVKLCYLVVNVVTGIILPSHIKKKKKPVYMPERLTFENIQYGSHIP